MANLLTLGSFTDPLNQDMGASKLTNVRAVVRRQEEGRTAIVRLVGTPGLVEICKPSDAECITLRHALKTIWAGYSDGSIYHGVETDTPTYAGKVTVNPDYPVIRMAEDRVALVIASNGTEAGGTGSGYTATQATGVVNANLQTTIEFDPSSVCVTDNITIWAGGSDTYANKSSTMYSSVPLDPANVPANSYATKEARADPVLDVVTTVRNFWPFGTRSIEQWYAAGGTADFPFVTYTNTMLDVGLAARRTLAWVHGKICWVGTDRRVWIGAAQDGQPISPPWVDLMLQQVDLQKLTAFLHSQGGDEFYVLTYENEWTIELAISTMLWNFRTTPGRKDFAGRCAAEIGGGVELIGLATGEVCRVDLTTAYEPAGVIEREIITAWIGQQETRHVVDEVQWTSYLQSPEAGTMLFDWSQDGRKTWKGLRTIAFPAQGHRRAIARCLGSSRRRQLRFRYAGTSAPFAVDELFAVGSDGS